MAGGRGAGGQELHGQAKVVDEVRRLVDAWRGFPLGRAAEPWPVEPARYEPRAEGEHAISETTRTLLRHWFRHDPHEVGSGPGAYAFKYWPHQRRVVETFVYLHEARRLRRTEELYRLCGVEALGRQRDPWAKLGAQLATGSGKTKIMSLLITWAHFNAVLEAKDALGFGRHALVIAPGLFVRDRLLQDFKPERKDMAAVFFADPVIPPELQAAWDLTVYSPADCPQRLDPMQSVLVVTNYHQLLRTSADTMEVLPSDLDHQLALLFESDEPGKLEDVGTPLLDRFADSRGLLVLNDEAHHVGDEPAHAVFEEKAKAKARLGIEEATEMAWIRALRRLNGSESQAGRLALQVDMSATLFEERGAKKALGDGGGSTEFRQGDWFRHAVVHYGLATAIQDGIVKRPVLERVEVKDATTGQPEPAVRPGQPNAWQTYRNLLATGIERWRRVREQLAEEGSPAKPIVFVICTDRKEAREIANYLQHGESTQEDLSHREPVGYLDPTTGERLFLWTDEHGKTRSTVLEIHVGSKEESNEEEWNRVRHLVNAVDADEIPDPDGEVDADGAPLMIPNPYNVVVSVMMLKEGWDVRNVKVIVPLRPCDSRTLTEQVLGRGLRKIHPPQIDDEGAASMRPEELYVIEHPSFKAILDQIEDLIERKSSDEISHARDYVPILQKEDEAERAAHAVRLVTYEGLMHSVEDWRSTFDVTKLPALVPRMPWHEKLSSTEIHTRLRAALEATETEGLDLTLSEDPSYRDFDHVLEGAYARPLLREMRLSFQHSTGVKGVACEFLERKAFALPAGVPLSFGRVMESSDAAIALGNLARGEVISAVRGALRQPLHDAITKPRGATEALLADRSSADLLPYQAPNQHVTRPTKKSNFDRSAFANQEEQRLGWLLDDAEDVEGWVYNHRHGVGWSVPYDWQGVPSKYFPDFVVRARFDAVVHDIVIEVKGRYDDRDKAKARAAERYCALLGDHDREPWHYLFLLENESAGRKDISWWRDQSITRIEDLLRRHEALPLVPGEAWRDEGGELVVVREVPVAERHVRALPVLSLGAASAAPDGGLPEPVGWARLRLTRALDPSWFLARLEDDALSPAAPRGSWGLFRSLPERFTSRSPNLDGRRIVARVAGADALVLRRWRVMSVEPGAGARVLALQSDGVPRMPDLRELAPDGVVPLAELLSVVG